MILEAFIVAFLSFFYLGWSNGKFDLAKTISVNIAATVIGGLLIGALFYLILPAYIGILWGWYGVIALPMIIGSVILIIMSSNEDGWGILIQIGKIAVVLIGFLIIITTGFFHSDELYNIPQVTEIQNTSAPNGIFDPIDTKHVRLVDQDLAYSLAHNIIGSDINNLGSIYEIKKEEIHIQMVKNHEYWVAPLEFQDYWKWDNRKTSPGFIMIDAEDPFAEAKLYTGYNMRYMPSAYWGNFLDRHVYTNGYSRVQLEDFTFEVTDELLPRWTVSKTKPTINNDGYIVESVISVDPESGKIEEYPVGQVPAWIDRVTPERIAKDYATWRGALVHGWWNAYGFVNIHEDVNELTTVTTKNGESQEMFFVYGSDNKPYWFSGMTSQSYSDQSLTSIVLVDARDPTRMIRIKMSGANEQGALDAVNSYFTNYPDRFGTAIIPYNVYGVLTYIIPVDSHTSSGNIFQAVGFVDAMSKHAVVRETKELALEEYKDYLATKNINKVALTSESQNRFLTGIVQRIGEVTQSGKSSFRLWLDDSDAIFSVNPTFFPVVSVTNVNDKVNITYIDTGDTVLEVGKFSNENVKARIGKDQIALDRETANLTMQKTENWDKQQELQKEIERLKGR